MTVEPHYTSETAPRLTTWRDLFPLLYSLHGASDGKSLWAVGGEGAILHTDDGEHWTAQTSGTTNNLRSVYGASDGKSLWAVGENGTVLHTDDGEHWTAQISGTTDILTSVYGASDGKSLWAVGWNGTILHTTDGEHWTAQMSGTPKAINSVYGASDGKSLWAVGENGTILHTADGEHWTAQTSGAANSLYSIYGASGGKSLWAVGENGTILHTADGAHWTAQTSGTINRLYSVYGASNGKSLWVVGENGTILHTDDGEHWVAQISGTPNELSSVYGASDGKLLWAVGSRGTVLHTVDGERWTTQISATYNHLTSVYGARDGKSVWVVGSRGTILHTADGERWTAQISGTYNNLSSVYGASDGKSVWAVGSRGTILHTAGGEHWTAQISGTHNDLRSVYGSGDGRSVWAVGWEGTILHTTDGEHWTAQISGTPNDLSSVYGTRDGKLLWAVGAKGTILHTADGEHWTAQISGTTNYLSSVYAAGDGKSVWAVGSGGTILHTADGEHWTAQTSSSAINNLTSVYGASDGKSLWAVGQDGSLHTPDGEQWTTQSTEIQLLNSVYGTSDGKSLWAVGNEGRIFRGLTAGLSPFVEKARIEGAQVKLQTICPNGYVQPASVRVTGRNRYKFDHKISGHRFPEVTAWNAATCTLGAVPFNPENMELGPGDRVYFDISFRTAGTEQTYHFDAVYDPWYWFREHKLAVTGAAIVLIILGLLTIFLYTKPLWNLQLYRSLKLAQIEKLLSGIPGVGPPVQFALKSFTILPWLVTHSRTLDAWVACHQASIGQTWGLDTQSGAAGGSLPQLVASTSYIPLPIRLADPSGELISEPSAAAIGGLFTPPRVVIEIVGPGGAGKTTLARQIGNWALQGGRPGGLPGHAMLPVWIDEDLDSKDNSLTAAIKGKLAAELPDEKLEDEVLSALLRKQRLLVIVDRLSERSAATQQHIERIFRSTRVEALVITTRSPLRPDGSSPVFLYPQPLDSNNLLRFMTSLMAEQTSIEDQLTLGARLAKLFHSARGSDGTEAPIFPLPVRLFVEDAIRLIRSGRSLDELPLSIPDIYFRYLEQVNPKESHLPNFLTVDEMNRVAMLLAEFALGDDFVPKEVFKDEAKSFLNAKGWVDRQGVDPIQRLVDNGVLLEKSVGGFRRIRFVLDPVAENLASAAYVRRCKGDAACLKGLLQTAAKAPGFQKAVELAIAPPH